MRNAEVNFEGLTTREFSNQTSAFSVVEGGSNSVVESQPSKLLVAGSIPVSRSIRLRPLGVLVGYGEMPRRIRRKVVWGS